MLNEWLRPVCIQPNSMQVVIVQIAVPKVNHFEAGPALLLLHCLLAFGCTNAGRHRRMAAGTLLMLHDICQAQVPVTEAQGVLSRIQSHKDLQNSTALWCRQMGPEAAPALCLDCCTRNAHAYKIMP